MCCDCSLVHVVNVKRTRKGVLVNFRRDNRAMAAARRALDFTREEEEED